MAGLLMTLLSFTGLLLMFIILLQRGRGGGLAGAFGGAGGQSAFGTRAGDVFTRITVGLVVVWVVLAGATGFAMRSAQSKYTNDNAVAKDPPEVSNAGSTLIDEPKEKKADDKAGAGESGEKPVKEEPSDKTDGKDKDEKPSDAKEPAEKPAAEKPTADKPTADEPTDDAKKDDSKKSKEGDAPAKEGADGEAKDEKKPDAPKSE